MRTIRTFNDLDTLLADTSISEALTSCVQDHYLELFREQNSDDWPSETFSLDPQNSLVVAEPGDQLLQRFCETPFGPEYVEYIEVQGEGIYRIGFLLDNDWIAVYFVPAGILDEPTKRWLEENGGFGS